MTREVYDLAIPIAAWGAYLRVACVLLASVRTLRNRRRFVIFKMGWAEIIAVPEPFLLLATTYALYALRPAVIGVSVPEALAAAAGALLVLAGWAVTIWAFLSWPGVFVGHGVVDDHRLMTGGAYGVVRHPIYLGVFLTWLGVSLAFASPTAFLLSVAYVIPSYVFYMRSEEAMMTGAFGDSYRAYRRAVPFLVPRFGGSSRSTQPARA